MAAPHSFVLSMLRTVLLLCLPFVCTALELVTRTDAGSASGVSGNIGAQADVFVSDSGEVVFGSTTAASELDPTAFLDNGNDWDLFAASADGAVRAISLAENFLPLIDPEGQLNAIAGSESIVLEMRYWEVVDPFLGIFPATHALIERPGEELTTSTFLSLPRQFYLQPRLSRNGRYLVAAAGSTALVDQVIRFDTETDVTTQVAVRAFPPLGHEADDVFRPDVSNDGRTVSFESGDNGFVVNDTTVNVTDVFVSVDGVISRVNRRFEEQADNLGLQTTPASHSRLDASGRFVFYQCDDGYIVPADLNGTTDIFRLELSTQETRRVSLTSLGEEIEGQCIQPDISADGRFLVFCSDGANLPGANGVLQVYLRDLVSGQLELMSINEAEEPARADCSWPVLSPSGRYVAFQSAASSLLDDPNSRQQVFLVDRGPGFLNLPPVSENVVVVCTGMSCEVSPVAEDAETDSSQLRYVLRRIPAVVATVSVKGGQTLTAGAVDVALDAGDFPLTVSGVASFVGTFSLEYVAIDAHGGQSSPAWLTVHVLPGEPIIVELASVADRSLDASDGETIGGNASPLQGDGLGLDASGQRVGFASQATNLTVDGAEGILVRDTVDRTTASLDELLSNVQFHQTVMSADGSCIAYARAQSIVRQQLVDGSWLAREVAVNPGLQEPMGISRDGSRVVFATQDALSGTDTDGAMDVYLWYPESDELLHISHREEESVNVACGGAAISDDGQWVAFASSGQFLDEPVLAQAAIWWRHLASDQWGVVPFAGAASRPSLSQGGRYVACLVDGKMWVYDRLQQSQQQVGGADASGRISGSGRYLGLIGLGTGYAIEGGSVPIHSGAVAQAWRYDWQSNSALPGSYVDGYGTAPVSSVAISVSGRHLAWASQETMFMSYLNGKRQVFVSDLGEGVNAVPNVSDLGVVALEDTVRENISLVATDADGDDLVFEIVQAPSHGTLVDAMMWRTPERLHPRVDYQPAEDFAGQDGFVWRVSDGIVTVSATVSITVLNLNDPPALGAIAAQATDEGVEVTVPLQVSDPDLNNTPSDQLGVSVIQGGGEVVDLVYRFTPPHSTVTEAEQELAIPITLQVVDQSGASDTETFLLTVGDVNSVPRATNVVLNPTRPRVTDSLTFSYSYVDGDADPEGETVVAWFTRADSDSSFSVYEGTVEVNGRTQSIPVGDARKGSEWFVRVTPEDLRAGDDALAGDPVETPVRVVENSTPTLTVPTISVTEDASVTLTLEASDPDPEDTAGIRFDQPNYGTLSELAGGGSERTLRYEPEANFFGVDTFIADATDGQGFSRIEIQIDVVAVPDPPVAFDHEVFLLDGAEGATVALVVTDPDEPEGISPVSYRLALVDSLGAGQLELDNGSPLSGDVSLAESVLFVASEPGVYSDETVRFEITDGDGLSTTAELRVVVGAENHDIRLEHGWNLCRLPATPVVSEHDLFAEGVVVGPGGRWLSDGYIRLMELSAGPIWLLARRSYSSTYAGVPAPADSELTLRAGWNFVGPTGRIEGLDSVILPHVGWAWDARRMAYFPTESIPAGRAVWLYSESELVVPFE